MVASLKHLSWICAALLCLSVGAHGAPTFSAGQTAPYDITATVPFDVVNAPATAELKAKKASYVPVMYRSYPHATNAMVKKYLAAFAETHSKFQSGLDSTFQTNITDAVIASPDFGYYVTEFDVINKNFPVSPELAAEWARGDSGADLRDLWLGQLLEMMDRPVQPDTLPPGFTVRRSIRLVPVKSLTADLTLDVARHGHVVPATNVITISNLRALFRAGFRQDEQPMAQVLAGFLQPNCFPDPDMTQQARDFAIQQIVVSDHYDTGQVIARGGQVIDAQVKAALDAMNEKMIPVALNAQVAAEHAQATQDEARAQQAQQQAQNAQVAAQLAQQQQQLAQANSALAESQAQQANAQAAAMHAQELNAEMVASDARTRNEWLIGALAAVSVLAVLIFVWLLRRRTAPVSVPARLERIEKPAIPSDFAPLLAQSLKDAIVQGLAAQRSELLEAQRQAAAEIADLVERLDRLHAPMQERLRAYQDRILELEKDLVQRTEENRELLKLKIEMIRQHLEKERGRVKLN
jgi:hypothetical protein